MIGIKRGEVQVCICYKGEEEVLIFGNERKGRFGEVNIDF